MTEKTTRTQQYSDIRPTLFMAFEPGMSEWKLVHDWAGAEGAKAHGNSRHLEKVQREIVAAKKRFQLPETAEVVSCYEAGRDGFRHRANTGLGARSLHDRHG